MAAIMSKQWPSFDGKILSNGGNDKRIILWDARKGELLTELKGNR